MLATIFEPSVFHFTPLDVLRTPSLLTAKIDPGSELGPATLEDLELAASLANDSYYQHLITRIAHGRDDNFIDQLEAYNRQALCYARRFVKKGYQEHAARMTVVERGLLN